MNGALKEHIAQLRFNQPDGGYFIWSHLPLDRDAQTLLAKAHEHQVDFQPGIKFSSNQGLKNYIRFCFAFYGEEDLVEGTKRAAKVINPI